MKKKIPYTAFLTFLFCAVAATAQKTETLTTLPHPPSPSLVTVENQARSSAQLRRDPLPVLSGADRRRIKALRAPNPHDLAKYKDFLGLDGTGIFRLFPDAGCVQKGIIRVDGECANHVPGASSYSFRGRTTMYDIRFDYGDLIADGFLSLPMMVSLGDVDLENLTLASDGVKFLTAYKPASIFEGARNQYATIRVGTNVGDFLYANRLKPMVETTYAIRVVAYKPGNEPWAAFGRKPARNPDSEAGRNLLALKYDNRQDLIVAFRVIRLDADGSVSILWRRISKKSAPKLMFDDDDQDPVDFK